MKEFFTQDIGKLMKGCSERTSKIFQGRKIYKVTEKLPEIPGLKKRRSLLS